MQEFLFYDVGRCCMLLLAIFAVIDGIINTKRAGKIVLSSIGLPTGILLVPPFLVSLASQRNVPSVIGALLCIPLFVELCMRFDKTKTLIPTGAQLAGFTTAWLLVILAIFTNPWDRL